MSTDIHLDFETRSRADITLGSWEYSLDPSTEMVCMAARVGDTWLTGTREEIEHETVWGMFALLLSNATIWAWNVQFEQAIWRNVLHWPEPKAWRCTMALAASFGLPQSLQKAAEFFGLDGKYDAGKKIMLKCCQPQKKTGEFYQPTHAEFDELLAYCRHDVELEHAVGSKLGGKHQTEMEDRVWQADNAMNLRGIGVDRELAQAAKNCVRLMEQQEAKALELATKGAVPASMLTQLDQLIEWLASRGVDLDDLKAATVSACLRRKSLPDDVRTVLLARQRISKISVKKFDSILAQTARGGRLRGQLRFAAAHTKRWKSKGEYSFRGRDEDSVQVQNLPKPKIKHECLLPAIADVLAGSVPDGGMDALVSLVRPTFIPVPGKTLAVVDYAAIEARVVLWLANDQTHLDWFRRSDRCEGREPYCLFADKVFGKTITDKAAYPKERDCGKVGVLLCGYQGGAGRFDETAKSWGVDVSAAGTTPEIVVQTFRDEFASLASKPNGLWCRLERDAKECVKTKKTVKSGKITFHWGTRINSKGALVVQLPSGSLIYYHNARIEHVEKKWPSGDTSMVEQLVYFDYEKESDQSVYGGKLAENFSQAVSRDLTADAMAQAHDDPRIETVLCTHDEIVAEVEADHAAQSLAKLEWIMRDNLPAWAEGLPVAVDGYLTSRYAKKPIVENVPAVKAIA